VNNIVMGIKHLREKYGIKKVGILDWDVHAGDGTYGLLKEDKDILSVSLH
jgi:acetoin utilization deacetylase AcuC-like enzyme